MNRDFYLFLASRFCSASAMTLMRAAVAWHVFELTGSAFYLGLLGLVQFLPQLVLLLVGGAIADSYDRRRIMNVAQVALLLCGVVLYQLAARDQISVLVLFLGVVANAAALSFEQPARSALLPSLVPRDHFPRAVAFASTNQALAFATGPAIGGVVIAAYGVRAAYFVYVLLIAAAFVLVLLLKGGGGTGSRHPLSLRAVREGLAFVWKQPVILGCMTLDMFAVIFGGATALLPVYAKEVLNVGAHGYGVLTSSLEAGALLMSALLMLRPPVERAGRALVIAVTVFGLATIVFGLSRSFPLSIAAYALAGMADQVSVVMRQTAIQLSTPDELRGRVSAVTMIFIGASNQLGATESGFVAALTSPTFSVVSGGVLCLCVIAVVALRVPELSRYRISDTSRAGAR